MQPVTRSHQFTRTGSQLTPNLLRLVADWAASTAFRSPTSAGVSGHPLAGRAPSPVRPFRKNKDWESLAARSIMGGSVSRKGPARKMHKFSAASPKSLGLTVLRLRRPPQRTMQYACGGRPTASGCPRAWGVPALRVAHSSRRFRRFVTRTYAYSGLAK